MSYLDLNLWMLLPAVVLYVFARKHINCLAVGVSMAILLLVTLVFDNFIVLSGVVAYDAKLLSGIILGAVPIEDFAYTVFGVLVISSLWFLAGKSKK